MIAVEIPTKITRLLGIRVPIVQAGMSWASSSPALPLAVSRAGGPGVLAAGPMRMKDFTDAVDVLRAAPPGPFAVNLPLYRPRAGDIIDYLVTHPVPAIATSQGGPKKHPVLHDSL